MHNNLSTDPGAGGGSSFEIHEVIARYLASSKDL
jgi:hypothetical protein